jgi:rod shape-determining protein MreD
MRIGVFALVALLAVVLDSALAPEIEILGARPDFLVLVVVYGSLLLGGHTAIIAGFLMGLVVDSELPAYLGLHALALSITGYVSAGVWSRLVRANVLVQCVILFGASIIHDSIYYVVYYRNHMEMFGRFIVSQGVLGAVYTAALGALVFAIARVKDWRSVAGDVHG